MNNNVVLTPALRRISSIPLLLVALAWLQPAIPKATAQNSVSGLRNRIINLDDDVSFLEQIEAERSVSRTRDYPWLLRMDAATPRGTTGVSTWTGGTGNWSDGTMWNPSGAPNDSSADVFVDGGNTAVSSVVNIDSTFTVGRLTIDSGDTVNLVDNRTFFISNASGLGSLVNNGTFNLNSVGNSTDLRISGDVTFSGSGSVIGNNSTANRIFGANGGERLTIGLNQTISGMLQLGVNLTKFTNNGTIAANVNGGTLSVDPADSSGDAVNNGMMQASNGGTLSLAFGIYTNNGTIRALTGSAVTVNAGAVISGGTLTTTDLTGSGGVIQVTNGTFQNLTSTGFVRVPDNDVLFLSGTFTNNGKLSLESGGNGTDVRLSGDVTINGSGTINTTNTTANRFFGSNGGETLTLGSGMTVQGSFQLGLNNMKFTNNGLIDSNLSSGATLDPTDSVGDAINNGTIRASNGATLTLLFGNYTNTNGTISALTNSTVSISGGAVITGGVLSTTDLTGNGGQIVTGNDATFAGVTSNGYVSVPDNRTLRLSGTFTNNGVLALNSGGDATDLRISGDVTINGTGSFTTTNTPANRIYGSSGGETLTIGSGVTLGGSYQLGLNQIKFINNGTIDANLSGGVSLDPTDGANDAINNGVMQASNGGTLTLLFGNYTNHATIRALDSSFVNLRDGALIIGGTLTTSGSGVVQTINDASLQGVTNNGLLNIPDNTRLRLVDSLTNNGTLMMSSGGDNTELRIATDVTLSGTGTLTTSNTQANRIFGVNGNERLTIASGYSLQGSLQFGVNFMKFTNNGTIDANQSAGLSIDPTDAAGDAINNGTMQASNGGTMTLLLGSYTNNGIIRALNNSAVNLRDGALIIGGTLTTAGTGVIQTINDASLQDVTNNGLLNIPDNTRLRLFGTFTNNGTLMMSSGGNNTELRIGNDVTLSGTGSLTASNSQANRVFGVAGSERLTIASGYTLQGAFQLGVNSMRLTNNGTINSNASAGMTIDPSDAVGDAINNGVMEATSGSTLTLALGNYTNTNGTIQALTGSFVNLRDGAIIAGGTLTTTDLTGSGGVIQTINTATLQNLTSTGFINVPDNTQLRLAGTIVDNGIIQMSSGGNNTELRLSGDVTLGGNGTFQASNSQANRVFGLSGSETLTNGSQHTISGTMQLGVNSMNLINQGVINSNQSGGIVIDPASTVTNSATGIFRASNGATLSLLGGSYTNSGTYEALTGSLIQMSSDASLTNYDSGTMTMIGGTYRAVSSGSQATLNLNIGQIVNNAAAIVLDGANTIIHTSDNSTDALRDFNNNTTTGSFTITNGRNFDRTFAFTNAGLVTIGPMSLFTATQFDLSGTLTGAGTLTVSGALNWTDGTMSGSGITNANGPLNLTTTANRTLNTRTINAAGTTTWSGGGTWSAGDGAIFNNLASATFNASNTQAIAFSGTGAAATFNNAGTFNKSGSGTTTSIDAIFNNSATVNINSGTLALQRGGTDSGSFNDASGAALSFAGGTHALNAGSTVSGAGDVNFNAGTANFASGATYNISGLTSLTGGTANFANVASAATTNFISGTLTGTGTYNSSGAFTWGGGTMSGAGITNANGGLTLNGTTKTLVSRTLNNNGAATWSAGDISSGQGAVFNNTASHSLDASMGENFLFDQGGTRTTFNNAGAFMREAGSTTIEAVFNNTGSVTVASAGLLFLTGGGTSSGAFNFATISRIKIGTNDYSITDDAVLNGGGTIEFNSATTTFTGTQSGTPRFQFTGGTAAFNGITAGSMVTMDSGTLTGSGTFTDNLFVWNGGTITGSGIVNITGLTIDGAVTFTSRTLNLSTSGSWSAGDIAAGLGAIFNNNAGATFTDSFDGNWLFNQGGTLTQFNNAGIFTKSGGTGTTTLQLAFTNTGTLNANSGTLAFSQGVQGTSGIVNVGSGGTLDVSGGAIGSSAATLNANGNLSLGSHNFTVAVDYANANFGSGNSFNPRANVTGTGGINAAGNVNQTLSGDITGGTSATSSLAFGNFHVGDSSVTKNYAINNAGSSGPALRGALQTTVNGGNITDARLTGSGVTAGNWGPLGTGSSTSNFAVIYDPNTAGALSGQVIHVINNFDNVQDQNIAITGAAYRLASASTHTPEPVNFGVVHIGESPSQALTVSNTAANDGFSEKLDGSIAPTSGGVTATGSFSTLAPQSSSTALSVGINTGSAGNKNGTATISLVSNGTGTSGLGNTNLTSQTVNVTGQVNYFADPVVIFKSGSATLTMQSATMFTLNFGDVQQNSGMYMAAFALQNFLHDATFQDSLGGTFDLTMINAFNVTGADAFSGIAPGSALDPNVSFNSAMNLGTYTGKVQISPNSANASSTTNLNSIQLNLSANIVPEPSTLALIVAGASLLVGIQVRRKRR